MKATDFIFDVFQNISSWIDVDTNYTLIPRANYLVDTTSQPVTLTIPEGEKLGDQIIIRDKNNTFNSNNVTLSSSNNIKGSTENVTLDINGSTVILIYIDESYGWQLIEDRADYIKNIEINDSEMVNGAIIKFNQLTNRFEFDNRNPITNAPVLSGPSSASELNDVIIVIDNYNATNTYDVTVPAGSVTRNTNTITWTLPDVSYDYTYAISVSAQEPGKNANITTKNVTVRNIPQLDGPDNAQEETIVNLSILNFHSSYTYDIDVTHGSASRTDDNIAWTLPTVADDTSMTLTLTSTGTGGSETITYQLTAKDTASLTGPTTEAENLIVNITISDYDELQYTYSENVTAGSVSRTGDNIEWTLPEVTTDTTHTLTVTQHETGLPDTTSTWNVLVTNIPVVTDTVLNVSGSGFDSFIEDGEDYSIGSVEALSDTAWVLTTPEYQDSGESDFGEQTPSIDIITDSFNIDGSSTVDSLILDGDATGIDDFYLKYSEDDLVEMIGNVSGISVQSGEIDSMGSEQVFNSGTTQYTSAVRIDDTHICVSYRDNSNSSSGTSIIGTISGNSISWGSPQIFYSGTTNHI